MEQGDYIARNQIIAILVFLKQMQANATNCQQMQSNGSKCSLDTDTDTDTEKGVWGKNAREEAHPHSHWSRDRKIQVLSLFTYFNRFTNFTEILI